MPNTSNRSSLLLHSSSDLYGASKILLTTIQALKERKENIQVVLSEEGPLADEIRKENIVVHIIRLGILRRKYFNPLGLINRSRVLFQSHRSLVRLCRKEKITHIYSNTSGVLVGAIVARSVGAYHTWHLHEIIPHPKWFANLLGKLVNRYSDQVLVVSLAVKKHWEKQVLTSKIRLIHNGIDYRPFVDNKEVAADLSEWKKDFLLVGMIGRINHWKGQPYFLDISHQISKSYPQVRFVMVGDVFPGDEHLEVEMWDKLKRLQMEDRIKVLGFRRDVAAILSTLDLFVLPSIQPDPFPTVILEAMASATPVVATAHGGACEMLEDGKTGVLIPWDNAEAAAAKIKPLLDDQALRKEQGQVGRQRVLEKFSLESFGDQISKVFAEGEHRQRFR